LPGLRPCLVSFRGVKRRQELRGESRGIKVIDDFGKHPANIEGVLSALSERYPRTRIWAAVDLKSATLHNIKMHQRLVDALKPAYGCALGPLERPDRFKDETLRPKDVIIDISNSGGRAIAAESVDQIIEWLATRVQPGDIVVGFSSGSFLDFHNRLLAVLAGAPTE
jgi:UDP-N-acetylmuramate: L-alanyl-gamma-D-glutamyl-meso-diaminopimelate ligase